MPPILSTLDDEISNLILSAQRQQKDLSEFQIPRLRTCNGPLPLQQNLAAELREDIEAFARKVEALDILVGDQTGEGKRKALTQTVDEFRVSLVSLRKDARTALLVSKRAIDAQSKSHREELLNSFAVSEKRDPNEKVTDDALMKASHEVTEALQRTIGLMQGELERSVLSSQMLDASTASLRSTSSTHDTLNNLMGTSKQLITALEKSDWLDRVLIISALIFFFLVVLFILKQRIVDRGLRIAFWWTRFLPDFSGDAQLMEAGEVITGAAAAVSSTSAFFSTLSAGSPTSLSLSEPSTSLETQGSKTMDDVFSSISDSAISSPTFTSTSDISARTLEYVEHNHVEL